MAGNYRTRGYWDVSTSDTAFSNASTNAYNPWNRGLPIVAPSASRESGQGYTSDTALDAIPGVTAVSESPIWSAALLHNGNGVTLAFWSTNPGVNYDAGGSNRQASNTAPTFVPQANGTRLTPAQTYALLGLTEATYDANGITVGGIPLILRFDDNDNSGWRVIGVGNRDGGNSQGVIQVQAVDGSSIDGAGGDSIRRRTNNPTIIGDNEVVIDGSASGLTSRRIPFTETTVFFNKRISIRNGARLFFSENTSGVTVAFVNCRVTVDGTEGNTESNNSNGYNFNQFHSGAPINNQPNHFIPRPGENGAPSDFKNYNGTGVGFQRRPPDLGRQTNSNAIVSFGSSFTNNLPTLPGGTGRNGGAYFANANQVICAAFGHIVDTVFLSGNDDVAWELFTQPNGYPSGTLAERDAFYADSANAYNARTDNFATWRLNGTTNQYYNGTAWVTDTENPDGHRAGNFDVGVYDNSSAATGAIVVTTKPTAVNSQPIFNGTVPQLSSNSFGNASADLTTGNNPGLDSAVVRINQYANANPTDDQYLGIQNGNSFRYSSAEYRVGENREYPNRTPFGYIMSNAVTKLPDDADVRRSSVRFQVPASNNSDDARAGDVIWTTIWNPTFNEDPAGVTQASGIRVSYNSDYTFATADTATQVLVSPLRQITGSLSDTILTNEDGRLVSSTARNPHDGRQGVDGSMEFTFLHTTGERNQANNGYTGAGGATASFSQSRLFTSTISMRGYWQTLQGATNGVRTITINNAGEIARGTTNTNANGDLLEDQFHPADNNLPSAVALTPSTRTDAALLAAINGQFPNVSTNVVNGSEIYSATKYYHWNGTNNLFPTVVNGVLNWGGNLTFGAHNVGQELNGTELTIRSARVTLGADDSTISGIDIGAGSINASGVPLNGNFTAANLGGVTARPTRDNEIVLAGTFNITNSVNVNVSGSDDVYLPLRLTGTNSITINRVGSGTGQIIVTTADNPPAPGGTATRPTGLTLGNGVVLESTPDVGRVREPYVVEFTSVPTGANWTLIDFSSNNLSTIASLTTTGVLSGSHLAGVDDARVGGALRFRVAFPADDVNTGTVEVPTDQRSNAVYAGLELAGDFPSATKIALVVFGENIESSITFLNVDRTMNDRLTTEAPNPQTSSVATVSRSFTTFTTPTAAQRGQVSISLGSTAVADFNITGHSILNTGERKATATETNAIYTAFRGLDNYGLALWNSWDATGAADYPQNLIGTANVSIPFDIVNTPNTTDVNVRQGTHRPNGTGTGDTSVEQLSGVYVVNNDATLSALVPTPTQLGQGITADSLAVQQYAMEAARARVGAVSAMSPSVISDERTLTAASITESNDSQTAALRRIIVAMNFASQ